MKQAFRLFTMTWVMRILALQAIVMSLATVLSEITLFTNINISLFGMFIDASGSIVVLHILILTPLLYIFSASIFSLFNLRLSGVYGMYKNNHTDSTSLLFLSSFMCRVGFPLCINFVQILKLGKKTILEDIVGSTELDPLFGSKFMYIYPAALLLLVILNILNIYGHLLRLIGISSYNYRSDYAEDKINEGAMIFSKSK